jgi:peptide chain release factor 2
MLSENIKLVDDQLFLILGLLLL